MAKQVSFWKQALVAGVILVLAGWGWTEREAIAAAFAPADVGERAKRPGGNGVPVIAAAVTTARDDLSLEAVGTGRAQRSIALRSETEGKIVDLAMAAGRVFEAGDVLLKLDDAEQRLLLRLAETRLGEAERAEERLRQLVERGASTSTQLDEARTLTEISRLEVERAREALDDRVLRAPFDGVAGLSELEQGAWVDNNMEVASFDDRSVILVGFDLPEALLARVEKGLAVTATTPSAPGQVFEGTVAAIDSRIEAASRTVRVRVALPNPDDALRPGASFTVKLDLPGEAYPVVPEIAVLFGKDGLHVWRVAGNEVEKVNVEMVRRREGEVLVDGPLSPGDRVVIEGTQRLSTGRKIRLLEQPTGGS